MKKKIIENIKTIIYALIIALIIRSFLFQPFYIPSSSMEPNLLVGDRLFVSKYSYGYSRHSLPFSPNLTNKRYLSKKPERGDVIVFKTPADNRTDYIKRMEKSLKRHGSKFKNNIFSKNEITYCDKKKNSGAFYAKRFAAKEALSKALGTGIRKDIKFKNIEIHNDSYGKPSIRLKGAVDDYLKKKIKRKKYNIHLSLSDDRPWAQATVIISYN